MTEVYNRWSWGKPYISKKEIETMLKNMKKVPLIKKQADLHQQQESQEAEKLLQKVIQDDSDI